MIKTRGRCYLSTFLSISALILWLVLSNSVTAAPTGAQVAIYTGAGTWEDGITAFERFLNWKEITWEEVNAWDINKRDLSALYDALYMPGGWSASYKKSIRASGEQHIRDLVSGGGAYIGICAGAYYAASTVDWEGKKYDYPLKLFDGTAYGAIDAIAPWDDYTMTTVNMDSSHPINTYEPPTEDMLYYGGPAFYPNAGQSMDIVSTWDSYNDDPATITFGYGSGRVLLIGPHPEIEEDSDRDGSTFADELDDNGSDWNFLWTAIDWAMGWEISRPPGDTTPPVINSISDSPDPLNAGDPLEITANVTDNVAVDSVWVEINGVNDTMTQDTGSNESSLIFFDGFESGSLSTNNWVTYGPGDPWIVTDENPYNGTYHGRAKKTGAGDDSYLEVAISTVGFSNIEISYHRQLIGLDAADKFVAEWFDGTDYHVLESKKRVSDNSYVYKVFFLPSGASENPNFKIRFTCECGAVSEEARLDDVKVTGCASGTGLWTHTYDTTGLSSGLYKYTVYAKDTSGNNAVPSTGDFTIN